MTGNVKIEKAVSASIQTLDSIEKNLIENTQSANELFELPKKYAFSLDFEYETVIDALGNTAEAAKVYIEDLNSLTSLIKSCKDLREKGSMTLYYGLDNLSQKIKPYADDYEIAPTSEYSTTVGQLFYFGELLVKKILDMEKGLSEKSTRSQKKHMKTMEEIKETAEKFEMPDFKSFYLQLEKRKEALKSALMPESPVKMHKEIAKSFEKVDRLLQKI